MKDWRLLLLCTRVNLKEQQGLIIISPTVCLYLPSCPLSCFSYVSHKYIHFITTIFVSRVGRKKMNDLCFIYMTVVFIRRRASKKFLHEYKPVVSVWLSDCCQFGEEPAAQTKQHASRHRIAETVPHPARMPALQWPKQLRDHHHPFCQICC